MEPFVNRSNKLRLINDSFDALLDRKRLLRTPIIEIQGVGGIGKTSLLRQVERRCYDTKLPYIWVDVSQNPSSVADEVVPQMKKYTQENEIYVEQSPVHAAKILLEQGPVVMLFDSVDMAKEINEATDVLNWSMARADFSVDEPIRTIFLFLLKIDKLQYDFAILDFLVRSDSCVSRKFSGYDCVCYIRECLYYHTVWNASSSQPLARLS